MLERSLLSSPFWRPLRSLAIAGKVQARKHVTRENRAELVWQAYCHPALRRPGKQEFILGYVVSSRSGWATEGATSTALVSTPGQVCSCGSVFYMVSAHEQVCLHGMCLRVVSTTYSGTVNKSNDVFLF